MYIIPFSVPHALPSTPSGANGFGDIIPSGANGLGDFPSGLVGLGEFQNGGTNGLDDTFGGTAFANSYSWIVEPKIKSKHFSSFGGAMYVCIQWKNWHGRPRVDYNIR